MEDKYWNGNHPFGGGKHPGRFHLRDNTQGLVSARGKAEGYLYAKGYYQNWVLYIENIDSLIYM